MIDKQAAYITQNVRSTSFYMGEGGRVAELYCTAYAGRWHASWRRRITAPEVYPACLCPAAVLLQLSVHVLLRCIAIIQSLPCHFLHNTPRHHSRITHELNISPRRTITDVYAHPIQACGATHFYYMLAMRGCTRISSAVSPPATGHAAERPVLQVSERHHARILPNPDPQSLCERSWALKFFRERLGTRGIGRGFASTEEGEEDWNAGEAA